MKRQWKKIAVCSACRRVHSECRCMPELAADVKSLPEFEEVDVAPTPPRLQNTSALDPPPAPLPKPRLMLDQRKMPVAEIRAERKARDPDPVIVRIVPRLEPLTSLAAWVADPRDWRHAGAVWGALDPAAEPSTRDEAREVLRALRIHPLTREWSALHWGRGPEELRRRVASAALWCCRNLEESQCEKYMSHVVAKKSTEQRQ